MIISTLEIILIIILIVVLALLVNSASCIEYRILGSGEKMHNLHRSDIPANVTDIRNVMNISDVIDTDKWDNIEEGRCVAFTNREVSDQANSLPGSVYMGSAYDKTTEVRKYIWQKNSRLVPKLSDREAWNPPVRIEEHQGFKIINEANLLGGTKQRGSIPLLGILPEKEFIYVGPYTGYAQIALALAAKLNNKIATLFIQKHRPMSYQTLTAIKLGAHVYEFTPPNSSLTEMRKRAKEYSEGVGRDVGQDVRLFMLGFQEQEFKNSLMKSLREAIPDTADLNLNITGTIWIAGGSATLANILYDLFPNAKINIVQIGKAIDWYINPKRSDFYVAPEQFYEPAQIKPPYVSVPEYDAKVWRFVKKHGKPGDYVWNVAGVPKFTRA